MAVSDKPIDRTHTDALLGDGWSWEDEDAFSPGLPDGDLMALVDELTASMAAGIPEAVGPETDRRRAKARAHPPGTRRAGGLACSAWVYPMTPADDTIVDFLEDVGVEDTSSIRDTLAAAARLSARLQRRLEHQRGTPATAGPRSTPGGGRPHRPEEDRRPACRSGAARPGPHRDTFRGTDPGTDPGTRAAV